MPKKEIPLQPIYLTEDKVTEIKAELRRIDYKILPEIRTRLATAYEDGDMPENNPWLTANTDLQEAMRRKNELRRLLSQAKLYKPHKEAEKMHLGSKIAVKIDGKEKVIQLVSSEEADPIKGKISVDSPIGKALVGQTPGITVTVSTPQGILSIEIL